MKVISEYDLQKLHQFSGLTSLDISYGDADWQKFVRDITDMGIEYLGHIKDSRNLNLSNFYKVTTFGMRQSSSLMMLRDLQLNYNLYVTGKGILPLDISYKTSFKKVLEDYR